MTRWPAIAALGVAALAFATDDPNAPLANTKEQLQSLKKDEAAQKAGTPSGVRLALPSLNSPEQELELPWPKRDDAAGKEKKRTGQKDWLLEGFDKLDRKKSAGTTGRTDRKSEEDEKPLDPNDPDYFLRVYERQRAERDAKQIDANAPDATELKGSADPFAPFMKEWLANSPVRDALKDVNTDRAADHAVIPSASGESARQASTSEPAALAPHVSTVNPFVQALGLPAPNAGQPAEVRTPTSHLTAAAGQSTQPTQAGNNTIYELPERPKVDLKHALPPPPSEDKKYFPQLKKF